MDDIKVENELDGYNFTYSENSPPSTKIEAEVFPCLEMGCGKVFPRAFALRRHMRIHSGITPYQCDEPGCKKKFNTSGNLSRHKRIHSGVKPYACNFNSCSKKFNTSTKLKRHLRIHFPIGEDLFRCDECRWSCDNYGDFSVHMKTHNQSATERDSYVNNVLFSNTAAAQNPLQVSSDVAFSSPVSHCSFITPGNLLNRHCIPIKKELVKMESPTSCNGEFDPITVKVESSQLRNSNMFSGDDLKAVFDLVNGM